MDDSPRSWMYRITTGILYAVYLAIATFFGTAWGLVGSSEASSEVVKQFINKTPPEEVFRDEYGVPKDTLNLLILGCDDDVYVENGAKKKRKGRSDMIMVAQVNFRTNSVRAISIPRDVWVDDMPGVRPTKVNALYVIGGPELTSLYVENLMGIKIDRVVDLDFRAFEDMIDILGGVEVFVPKRMKYTDTWADLYIDLQPGQQHLTGYEAMGYVRFRKTDNDFERQKRQKDFLLAVKSRIIQKWNLAPKVADKAVDLTGEAFTPAEFAALLLFGQSVSSGSIQMEMVPVYDIRGTTNLGIQYEALAELMTEMRFGNPDRVANRESLRRSEVREVLDRNEGDELFGANPSALDDAGSSLINPQTPPREPIRQDEPDDPIIEPDDPVIPEDEPEDEPTIEPEPGPDKNKNRTEPGIAPVDPVTRTNKLTSA